MDFQTCLHEDRFPYKHIKCTIFIYYYTKKKSFFKKGIRKEVVSSAPKEIVFLPFKQNA